MLVILIQGIFINVFLWLCKRLPSGAGQTQSLSLLEAICLRSITGSVQLQWGAQEEPVTGQGFIWSHKARNRCDTKHNKAEEENDLSLFFTETPISAAKLASLSKHIESTSPCHPTCPSWCLVVCFILPKSYIVSPLGQPLPLSHLLIERLPEWGLKAW